jgi:hypothetical protein
MRSLSLIGTILQRIFNDWSEHCDSVLFLITEYCLHSWNVQADSGDIEDDAQCNVVPGPPHEVGMMLESLKLFAWYLSASACTIGLAMEGIPSSSTHQMAQRTGTTVVGVRWPISWGGYGWVVGRIKNPLVWRVFNKLSRRDVVTSELFCSIWRVQCMRGRNAEVDEGTTSLEE